jgi:hypothetical protein
LSVLKGIFVKSLEHDVNLLQTVKRNRLFAEESRFFLFLKKSNTLIISLLQKLRQAQRDEQISPKLDRVLILGCSNLSNRFKQKLQITAVDD